LKEIFVEANKIHPHLLEVAYVYHVFVESLDFVNFFCGCAGMYKEMDL
jgi:hypothetical protein